MRVELARSTPGVEAIAGSAESIPLGDSTVDAIACAQAFHWFDVDRALPEMWRVLRPDGGVGLIWNLRDETDSFQEGLSAIVGETDREWNVQAFFLEAAARDGLFGEGSRMSCPHEQLLPRAQLVDRVASMSAVALLDDAARAQVIGNVQAYAEAAEEPIRLVYVTEAYVFRRLD